MINDKIKEKIKKLKPFYEPNCIHDIFSWEQLESILNLRPFTNNNRFKILNNEFYTWALTQWHTDSTCFPINIIKEEIKNNFCYLTDASKINKKVNEIAFDLEKTTNLSVDAHIFFCLSENLNYGFGIHNDNNDNFIVQIEGQTNFKVWDIKAKEEEKNIHEIKEKPYIDVVMNKGDVIFIPKKYWHLAESKTKRLSISFPMANILDYAFEQREWLNIEDYL
jgi:hypothetical protein